MAPVDGGHVALDLTMKRGQTFAQTGILVTFKDLTYSVPSNMEKGKQAFLLNRANGFLESGQMTALMGPSGSGKTTLLDILAGRKTTGTIEGQLLFSGQRPSTQFLRRYTGYVEQFDTLIPTLTVEEMLMYTAELKRSTAEPLSSKKEAVDELLKKLALESCRDVVVGNAFVKGISGGQAKRTNIGIALITNPRVLFLDEPTSGLDSYTANEVMTVVRQLVKDNTTICATIHSPTAYCFNLFDRMMMLVRGRVVYFGEQGAPAIEYARTNYASIKEYQQGYNDAEWLVDMFTDADRQGKGGDLADIWERSTQKQEEDRLLELRMQEKAQDLPPEVLKELQVTRATVTPWWWAFKTLVKYRTTKNYKDGAFLGPRIGDKLIISLLVLTLYLNVGERFTPDNYINQAAVLFMWAVMPAFGAAAYVPALVLERALFVRERSDGLYRVITYLLHKMFDELVIAAIMAAIVSTWVFYAVKLQGSLLLFILAYYLTLCTGIVLAYFVAALSPNMDVANAALPAFVVTLLFFAGFLFRLRDIPSYWYWYSVIDFVRYGWSATMVNQFEGRDTPWINGETVLQYYGLDGVSKWNCLGYQTCFFVFFTFCAWLTLTLKKYQSR